MGQWDLSQLSLVADPGSVRGSGLDPYGRAGLGWPGREESPGRVAWPKPSARPSVSKRDSFKSNGQLARRLQR